MRWRLVRIDTLDAIQSNDLDRAEVYSEFVALRPGEQHDFDADFYPQESEPTSSI